MAESDSNDRTIGERQAALVLSEIAGLTACIERLGVLLVSEDEAHGGDHRDCAAYKTAIKALANQIGLLSDIGASAVGGNTLNGADPVDWLLPPVYPR